MYILRKSNDFVSSIVTKTDVVVQWFGKLSNTKLREFRSASFKFCMYVSKPTDTRINREILERFLLMWKVRFLIYWTSFIETDWAVTWENIPCLQITQFTKHAVCDLLASVLQFTERRCYALYLAFIV
jgi:hypothetical protein